MRENLTSRSYGEGLETGRRPIQVPRQSLTRQQVFQQITEVFALRRLIGSTPQATVFQAAFCLLLYNMVQVLRGYIALAQPQPCRADAVSAEQLFYDVQRELTAVSVLVPAPMVVAAYTGSCRRKSCVSVCTPC